jgi:hypothetical protein
VHDLKRAGPRLVSVELDAGAREHERLDARQVLA